jgi:hypothetical protein
MVRSTPSHPIWSLVPSAKAVTEGWHRAQDTVDLGDQIGPVSASSLAKPAAQPWVP